MRAAWERPLAWSLQLVSPQEQQEQQQLLLLAAPRALAREREPTAQLPEPPAVMAPVDRLPVLSRAGPALRADRFVLVQSVFRSSRFLPEPE